MEQLIAALPASQHSRVAGIPLLFDPEPGSVNAFAACSDGQAAMAVTDELLEILFQLARARSTDERLGTRYTDDYVASIGRSAEPGRPLERLSSSVYPAATLGEPLRTAREAQLFDEALAFALGHELAHHYLGHLPCTATPGRPLGELGRALSSAVPVFNQPNEAGADISGVNNVLAAGRTTGWTESGGLLVLDFFSGVQSFSAADVLFGFERSHPAPQLRRPLVQQAANVWRLTGGIGMPVPSL